MVAATARRARKAMAATEAVIKLRHRALEERRRARTNLRRAGRYAPHTNMPGTPESWKNYSYDDPQRHWYEVLLEGNGNLDIPTLAQRWLQDLADTGLQEIETSSGTPPKEPTSYYPRSEPLHSEIVPIRLEGSREVLWLKPNGRRSGAGYKRAEILDTFLSTDRAILAAVTALEARETKSKDLSDELISGEVDFSHEEWPMPGDAEYEKIEQELAQLVDEGFVEDLEEDWTKDLREFRHVYDDPIIQTTHMHLT